MPIWEDEEQQQRKALIEKVTPGEISNRLVVAKTLAFSRGGCLQDFNEFRGATGPGSDEFTAERAEAESKELKTRVEEVMRAYYDSAIAGPHVCDRAISENIAGAKKALLAKMVQFYEHGHPVHPTACEKACNQLDARLYEAVEDAYTAMQNTPGSRLTRNFARTEILRQRPAGPSDPAEHPSAGPDRRR